MGFRKLNKCVAERMVTLLKLARGETTIVLFADGGGSISYLFWSHFMNIMQTRIYIWILILNKKCEKWEIIIAEENITSSMKIS